MRTGRSIDQLRWPRGTEEGGAYAEVERAKEKESINVVYLQQAMLQIWVCHEVRPTYCWVELQFQTYYFISAKS